MAILKLSSEGQGDGIRIDWNEDLKYLNFSGWFDSGFALGIDAKVSLGEFFMRLRISDEDIQDYLDLQRTHKNGANHLPCWHYKISEYQSMIRVCCKCGRYQEKEQYLTTANHGNYNSAGFCEVDNWVDHPERSGKASQFFCVGN